MIHSLLRLCWCLGEWGWGSGLLLPDSVSSELTDALCCLLWEQKQNKLQHKVSIRHSQDRFYPKPQNLESALHLIDASSSLTGPRSVAKNNSVLLFLTQPWLSRHEPDSKTEHRAAMCKLLCQREGAYWYSHKVCMCQVRSGLYLSRSKFWHLVFKLCDLSERFWKTNSADLKKWAPS